MYCKYLWNSYIGGNSPQPGIEGTEGKGDATKERVHTWPETAEFLYTEGGVYRGWSVVHIFPTEWAVP